MYNTKSFQCFGWFLCYPVRVEYFSFLLSPKCNVFTLTCSTLFSFTHFPCYVRSARRVSKNIKFRGDGVFGASDMWLMIWEVWEDVYGETIHTWLYSSFQCVLYTSTLWVVKFFFLFCCDWALAWKLLPVYNECNTDTQFSV